MFIEQEKANHAVALMCRLFRVSKSGYYAWRNRLPSARSVADAELLVRIKTIHEQSRGIYGAPRVHAELRLKHHIYCSNKRVARLMRQAGLVGVHRRRFGSTTQRDPKREAYPDLVERQFTADEPNKVWVADVTQHQTDEGWELGPMGRALPVLAVLSRRYRCLLPLSRGVVVCRALHR